MRNLLSFLFVFLIKMLVCQNVAVQFTHNNVLYQHIPSPFIVVADNIDCNDLVITSSQGKISKVNYDMEDCLYSFIPNEMGNNVILKIYNGIDTNKIGFRVKPIPLPTMTIGGNLELNENKVISKGYFKAQGVIIPLLYNFDYNGRYDVKDYETISISDTIFYFRKAEGPFFPEDFEYSDIGDVVVFNNFNVTTHGQEPILIEKPLIFGIDEVTYNYLCAKEKIEVYYSKNEDTVHVKLSACGIEYLQLKINDTTRLIRKYENNELLFSHQIIEKDSLTQHMFYYANGTLKQNYIEQNNFSYFDYDKNDSLLLSRTRGIFLKIGQFEEYYENGKLKTKGQFHKYDLVVDVDNSHIPFPLYGVRFYDTIRKINTVKRITETTIKEGLWLYYNEKGKVIKREWYEDGKLVKAK